MNTRSSLHAVNVVMQVATVSPELAQNIHFQKVSVLNNIYIDRLEEVTQASRGDNLDIQPFYTTKPTGSGTGLGLSLSYGIVKAHGGEICLDSTENDGTEFIIHLQLSSR